MFGLFIVVADLVLMQVCWCVGFYLRLVDFSLDSACLAGGCRLLVYDLVWVACLFALG